MVPDCRKVVVVEMAKQLMMVLRPKGPGWILINLVQTLMSKWTLLRLMLLSETCLLHSLDGLLHAESGR